MRKSTPTGKACDTGSRIWTQFTGSLHFANRHGACSIARMTSKLITGLYPIAEAVAFAYRRVWETLD